MISKDSTNWESLWTLKNWEFKIKQNIDEINADNQSILKIKAVSATIAGEVENINILSISNIQDNYTINQNQNLKELTLSSNKIDISPIKVKFVNTDSNWKTFTIELFNSIIKDSLSLVFWTDKESPIFKQPIEFIGFPDSSNNIFKISDEQ